MKSNIINNNITFSALLNVPGRKVSIKFEVINEYPRTDDALLNKPTGIVNGIVLRFVYPISIEHTPSKVTISQPKDNVIFAFNYFFNIYNYTT